MMIENKDLVSQSLDIKYSLKTILRGFEDIMGL